MKDEGFVRGAWPDTVILHPALHLKSELMLLKKAGRLKG
jgi:hypothetical protein